MSQPPKEISSRLLGYIKDVNNVYPDCFKTLAGMRSELRDWPDWCYCPMAGPATIIQVEKGMTPAATRDISIMAGLAAWRMTKGIFVFDETIKSELWKSEISGDIPCDILYQLPQWCVYIPIEKKIIGLNVIGFFAFLEYDVNLNRKELRILLDVGTTLFPLVVHLEKGNIFNGIISANEQINANARTAKIGRFDLPVNQLITPLSGMISLLLYLCSVNAEIANKRNPEAYPVNPRPKKVRRGTLELAANEPDIWEVGYRIGQTLRITQREIESRQGTEHNQHSSPVPHIRRAHWHTYWTGPKLSQKQVVKWLPTILVNHSDPDKIVPTIYPVK